MTPNSTNNKGYFEVSPVNEYFTSKDMKLVPPPLDFHKDSFVERPMSHFSMSSDDDEENGGSLRGSVFHWIRSSTVPPQDSRTVEKQPPAKRKRPLFSPKLSPRLINKKLRANNAAVYPEQKGTSSYQFITLPCWKRTEKKGSASGKGKSKARPNAVIVPTSERRPSGPDTPHPTNALHMVGSRAAHKMQRGMVSLKQAMTKAKRNMRRSAAERRRSDLRRNIKIIGEADQYPDGRVNQWM
ncbi:MAG: hypothetical protein M4579_002929 [Chaenotheca gracillima]|nr:MAG: hypothetical protein M4579_002929 [Chaenotheca gracillima]